MIYFKLEEAKTLLTSLKAQGADVSVINAQETVIKKLQKEANGIHIPEDATIKVKEVDGEIRNYKICHASLQRKIKYVRVDEFLNLFKNGKYEKAYPILAITVEKAKSIGLKIFDYQGNDITDTANGDWLVIIDGQHRAAAAAILNEENPEFCLENLILKEDITNLPEYLSTINGKEISNYSDADRLEILSIRDEGDALTKVLSETTKEGMSQATAERIFTGKSIPRKRYSDAFISGNKLTDQLSANEKESLNIGRGVKLRDTFLSVGIEAKKISRYWVEGFNSYAKATTEEQAFTALGKLKAEKIGKLTCGNDFVEILKKAYESEAEESHLVAQSE